MNQTYENIEIILVDDGSKDSSGRICDEYAEVDSRIKVVHQENKGMSLSRCTGIQMSKGEYLSFIDADDWIEPDFISYLYSLIVQNKADVASCDVVKDFPNGKTEIDSNLKRVVNLNAEQAIKYVNERVLKPYFVNKLFKKELLEKVVFNKMVTIGEDYRAVMQIFLNCKNVVCGNKVLYHYIQHANSSVYQGYKGNGMAILDSYTEIKDMIIKNYPDVADSVLKYWVLEEMAVITSMVKSDWYDELVINRVQKDLRGVLLKYLTLKGVPLYLKVCCVLISVHYKCLTVPYKGFFSYRYKIGERK